MADTGAGARRLGHVPELDVLRGVALVLVLLAHLWILWPTWGGEVTFSDGGFVGVDLFFVLSGFLITVLALDEQAGTGTIGLVGFYRRRAVRILPALYVALAAHLVYAIATDYPPFGDAGPEWDSIRAAALGFLNWHILWSPGLVGDLTPIWSLSIELQFYVLWPIVLLFILGVRRSAVLVVGTMVTLVAAAVAWRTAVFWDDGWLAAYLRSDTRVDALLVGALAGTAWIRRWTPVHLSRWLLVPAVGLGGWLVMIIDADEPFAYRIGITLFALATALVVLIVVTDPRERLGPAGRALAALGRFSYGIYLYHFAVFWAFQRWGRTWPDAPRVAGATATIAVLVTLSWILVERPTQRWRGAAPVSAVGVGTARVTD